MNLSHVYCYHGCNGHRLLSGNFFFVIVLIPLIFPGHATDHVFDQYTPRGQKLSNPVKQTHAIIIHRKPPAEMENAVHLCLIEGLRLRNGLRPTVHTELAINVFQMGLDRALSERELGGNLPIGQPGTHQP